MDSAWVCIVLSKNLCSNGEEITREEVQRLAGDHFEDFRMERSEFDGDTYAFLKFRMGMKMEAFRKSSYVVAILDSYDNPKYLSDEEVLGFVEEPEGEINRFKYGDIVQVSGESHFSGLHGIVTLAGIDESQVMFRLHTVTKRQWLPNDDLVSSGNVFQDLKVPVKDSNIYKQRSGKFPVTTEKERRVSTSKRSRSSD